MNLRILGIALFALTLSCGQALAWGWQGHEVVGSIADQLLSDHAREEVRKNLGFELRVAAPWADCVRSVTKRADGTFEYAPSRPEYSIPCTAFETPDGKARMVDYAKRNWQACDYQGGRAGCQDTYHYTDVAVQHDEYKRGYEGTNNHDIVAAITAAVAVLKDRPSPAPFSIKDKQEALFMLAHFLGDLHQPLHVGAVYLSPTGRRIDPDRGTFKPESETRGGNSILKKVDAECKGANLHSEWDANLDSLGTSANAALVKRAKAVPRTPGKLEDFAVLWASDTVIAAQEAYKGVLFAGACTGKWIARFRNRKSYLAAENALKHEQLAKGGAHLAELLNGIWQ